MNLKHNNQIANTEYFTCAVEIAIAEILKVKEFSVKFYELKNIWSDTDNMSGRDLVENYWRQKDGDFQIAKAIERDENGEEFFVFVVIDNLNNRAFLPI